MGHRIVASAVVAGAAGLALVLTGCTATTTAGGGDGLGNGLSTGALSSGSNASRTSGPAGASLGGDRIGVVVGEDMWGDIARQVGGSAVAVTSLINQPGQDPHQYEASLSDAAAVASAKLVIENGAGYDDFLRRLVSADSPAGRVVLDVASLVGLHGSNPNPHLWYEPRYVMTAAQAIAARLSALAPVERAAIAANLAAFLTGEQQVVAVIDQIRQRYGGTEVGYTERVPGYLLAAAGLRVGTPAGFAEALEDGDDPNPIDAARFQHEISAHRMKVLLYNAQVADPQTAQLKSFASSHGVPVVGVTETLPAGHPDFQSWQADQARSLLAALGG